MQRSIAQPREGEQRLQPRPAAMCLRLTVGARHAAPGMGAGTAFLTGRLRHGLLVAAAQRLQKRCFSNSGMVAAEQKTIEQYRKIMRLCEEADDMTQDVCIGLLGGTQSHRLAFLESPTE